MVRLLVTVLCTLRLVGGGEREGSLSLAACRFAEDIMVRQLSRKMALLVSVGFRG